MKYTKILRNVATSAAAMLLLLANSSCERRELWVFGDEFPQIVLNIDWRNYDRDKQLYPHTPDPQGMTVWFFPTDGRKSYQYTTTQVRRFETYLSAGNYRGLVIDYSPEEYGHQEFVGMDYANTAEVKALPSSYQSDGTDDEIFGPNAYTGPGTIPTRPNGHFTVAWQPEKMASDTVDMHVVSGIYDKYIPYKDRDNYSSTLTKQEWDVQPLIIPWRMRVRVYVKGIYYMYSVNGSITGLADGFFLAENHTSDDPCLIELDKEWTAVQTGENIGYIAKTFYTWGLRNSTWKANKEGLHPGEMVSVGQPNDVRLNLKFTLRDRKTVRYYHYNVGDLVRIFNNEYALRVDLMDDYADQGGIPDLPYVDAYNGVSFGAFVWPWGKGSQATIPF